MERLKVFPDARSWSVHLRLPPADADLLKDALRPLAGPQAQNLNGYREKAAHQPPQRGVMRDAIKLRSRGDISSGSSSSAHHRASRISAASMRSSPPVTRAS